MKVARPIRVVLRTGAPCKGKPRALSPRSPEPDARGPAQVAAGARDRTRNRREATAP